MQLLHFFLLSLLLSAGIKADSPVFEPFNLAEFEKSLELDLLPSEDEAAQEPDTEITRSRRNKKLRTLSVSKCAKINSLAVCSNAAIRCNLAVGGNLAVAGSGSFAGALAVGGPLTIGGTSLSVAGGVISFPGYAFVPGTNILNVIGNTAEPRLNKIRGTVNAISGAILRGAGFTSASAGAGSVVITFTVPFSSAPSITVSGETTTGAAVVNLAPQVTSVTTTGATLVNFVGGLPGTAYNFDAIGPVA